MIDETILANLLLSTSFRKRVIKHLNADHFAENSHILTIVKKLSQSYPGDIKATQLVAEYENLVVNKTISKEEYNRLKAKTKELFNSEVVEEDWLFKEAEKFTRDKSIYFAILEAIGIYENKDIKSKMNINDIPSLVSKAIDINFEPKLGLDFNNAEFRHDEYNKPAIRVPFRLETLNIMTNGGAKKKTLNIVNAKINDGKSMTLFALAADYMAMGYNVAVFTMEMEELEVMQRIDANLLETPINDVPKIEKDKFVSKINNITAESNGRLKIKEYYTGEGDVHLFKNQLEDWYAEDGFKPDVIVVDYLGICRSVQSGMSSQGSYAHLKQISVELRALAQFTDTVLWTAMQLNRDGIKANGGGMDAMSDSIGVPMTADFIILLQRTPELEVTGKVNIYQIKTRYNEKSKMPSCVLKLNAPCQKFSDDEEFLANLQVSQSVTNYVRNQSNEDSLAYITEAFIKEESNKHKSTSELGIKV